jgi:hypothetical protein
VCVCVCERERERDLLKAIPVRKSGITLMKAAESFQNIFKIFPLSEAEKSNDFLLDKIIKGP